MTLDEKLEQFYNAAIESATNQNIQIMDEYKQSLENMFHQHKEDVIRKAEDTYQTQIHNLFREKNRRLSAKTIEIRRKIKEITLQITDQLFEAAEKKLILFMKSEDYYKLLLKQIQDIKNFSGEEAVTVYINQSDRHLAASLETDTGVTLTISDIDFLGGTRAVIRSQNILIDHSFLTRLSDTKSNFTLEIIK